MSEEHVTALLSAFLDEALAPAERGRVEAHLPGCRACRDELDELRRVSKLVASLPKRELPPGFLTRLKARQRSAAKEAALPWLPLSPKAMAWGAAACIALIISAREIRYRLVPAILPTDMEVERIAPMTAEQELDQELSRRRRAIEAQESWRGVVEGGADLSLAPQSAVEAAPAARGMQSFMASAQKSAGGGAGAPPPAPAKARLKSDGAPVGGALGAVPGQQGPNVTSNESIYNYLQKEKKKMGIQEIITPGAIPGEDAAPTAPPRFDPRRVEALGIPPAGAGSAGELPDQPMSREDAMTVMRSMASGLSKMNEDYRWKKSPTVPLGSDERASPRLLAKSEASRPISPPANSASPKASSKPDNLTVPLASGARGHADDAAGTAAQQSFRDRVLPVQSSWSGIQGGMGAAGGAVLHRAADFQDMWNRIHFAPELPSVDFGKQMAVAVFGERSEASRSVGIVSVAEEGGRMMIRFRTKTDDSASAVKPSAPYHVVIVPTSDLPFDFIQVP